MPGFVADPIYDALDRIKKLEAQVAKLKRAVAKITKKRKVKRG